MVKQNKEKGYIHLYTGNGKGKTTAAIGLALRAVDLISLINDKPQEMELIMTGRYAPVELINIADLVTEMKEVKHYFKEGIIGRIGIEF